MTDRADGYVQDLASQWVADLVEARPGDRVADLCAAPGGKATRLAGDGATRGGRRPATGAGPADRRQRRAARQPTASTWWWPTPPRPPFAPAAFDRVLVDAPCSGLGALRRRPDARWRHRGRATSTRWPRLQRPHPGRRRAPLVRPGGTLVYSVCTLTAAESIDLADGSWPVLPPPPAPWRPYGRGARLLPQDADTDGMIVLRYVRSP